MSPDAAVLRDLAASVADGQPVDWSTAESAIPARAQSLVRHLRLVESIATLYRSIPVEEEEIAGAPPEPGGVRWGRLIIQEPIGQGTSCEVFRAFDTDLHREVALKLLHPDGTHRTAHTRILQEARRLARVTHPHVVQVYGAERNEDRVGLWMELVRGESLEEIVKVRGTLGAREAAIIGQEVCSALAAVHAAGLLHRDVKAQNVLREHGGRIVLMDFGTGEEMRDAGTPRLVGTPLYLAPEILQGQAASVQSDIYSVGVLLFYLATGQFPIAAATMEHLATAHAEGAVRRLRDVRPDLPGAFVSVVERALSPDLALRYRTAGEMEAALRDAPAHGVVPMPLVGATPSRPRTSRAALAVIGVLAIVTVALVAWARWGKGPVSAPGVITRVAVLPMVDLSPSPTDGLADGLTDQLIATLGQLGGIQVISRSSVMQYKGSAATASSIATELGVDGVIESTLVTEPRADGTGKARVNVRLIAAGAGGERLVWSRQFEGQLGDLLGLEAAIARSVVRETSGAIAPGKTTQRAAATTSPAAEEAYLQGRLHLSGYGIQPARQALDSFLRAVSLDPNHAAAHAGASRAYVRLGMLGAITQADARQSGLAQSRAALGLNPDLAEAHAALGDIAVFYDWDWETAETEYRTALDLNPSFSDARLYYAQMLAARGQFGPALQQSTLAMELDPASRDVKAAHAMLLYYKRDFAAARDVLDRAVLVDPGAAGSQVLFSRIVEAEGRPADALDRIEQAQKLAADGGVPVRVQRVRLEALSGHEAAARQGLAALQADAKAGRVRLSARDLGYARLALGDRDAALTAFEQALQERDPSLIWLRVDPRVDQLRGDARFESVLRAIGL